MFLYAWEQFEGGPPTQIQATEDTDLVEFFTKLLLKETSFLVRRRLDRGYESISGIEFATWPILISESTKCGSLRKNRLLCSVDELTPDLLHNQIIKSTIAQLSMLHRLDRSHRGQCETLLQYFDTVAPIRLCDHVFYRTKLTRNTKHYKLALRICELLYTHLLVGEGDEETSFAKLLNDEETMDRMFEAFVRNFYAVEQATFKVSRPQIAWAVANPDHPDNVFLPAMQTDIALQSPQKTMIMDTKFYGQILKGRHGQKVRSPHLYQLLTYLSQWSQKKGISLCLMAYCFMLRRKRNRSICTTKLAGSR